MTPIGLPVAVCWKVLGVVPIISWWIDVVGEPHRSSRSIGRENVPEPAALGQKFPTTVHGRSSNPVSQTTPSRPHQENHPSPTRRDALQTMAGGTVKYRHLSRNSAARQALLRGLVTQLVHHEHIMTTHAKAKEAQRMAEKLITLAKKDNETSRRSVQGILYVSKFLSPSLLGLWPCRVELSLEGSGRLTAFLSFRNPNSTCPKSSVSCDSATLNVREATHA